MSRRDALLQRKAHGHQTLLLGFQHVEQRSIDTGRPDHTQDLSIVCGGCRYAGMLSRMGRRLTSWSCMGHGMARSQQTCLMGHISSSGTRRPSQQIPPGQPFCMLLHTSSGFCARQALSALPAGFAEKMHLGFERYWCLLCEVCFAFKQPQPQKHAN